MRLRRFLLVRLERCSGGLLIRRSRPYTDRIPFSTLELRIVSALSCVFCMGTAYAMITTTERLKDGSILALLRKYLRHFADRIHHAGDVRLSPD